MTTSLVLGLTMGISFAVSVQETTRKEPPGVGHDAALQRVSSQLTRLLEGREAGGRFSGAVLVARGPDLAFHHACGLADRENELPFRRDAISTIGSITKQFTGAAILSLVDREQLEVNDPLERFFEDLPEDKKSITVHQLLTHTSGLCNILGADEDFIDRDELMELAWRRPLDQPPGERHSYSNLGYSVLAAIVEKLTESAYEDYLYDSFFEPLGMLETGYWLPDWDFERVPIGYRNRRAWGTVLDKQDPLVGPSWHLLGNGGVHSTLADLHRWVVALQRGEVLSDASRDALFAEHAPEGGGTHYGYGWSIARLPSGHRLIGHNGGNGFFFANLEFFPDDGGWMAAVLVNDPAHESIVPEVRKAITDEIGRAAEEGG